MNEPKRIDRVPVAWEPLLTPIEAAILLRIHPKTALRLARAKHVPALQLGMHWRFRQCDSHSQPRNEPEWLVRCGQLWTAPFRDDFIDCPRSSRRWKCRVRRLNANRIS